VAGTLPGFAIQALTFATPEAGTLVLLGTGAIGLALYGRRRMTK
jgi:N-acetylglucosamine kinase-like BadF-type ATPase